MSNRRIKTLLISLITIPLLVLGGILMTAILAGFSAGGTLSTDRNGFTHSNSMMLSSSLSSDTAKIQTDGRTIVVKPTQLIVDGTIIAMIDKSVSSLEVQRGKITFSANGKPVATSLRYLNRFELQHQSVLELDL